MLINGFEVDQYNVYHLDEHAKHSTCPICSADRKKKMDKCATLYWDKGLGQCWHCGNIFQLHTYKRKDEETNYVKPAWSNRTTLSERVVKWFEKRGISQLTLKYMKISEGLEWMPQTKKEENTIQFNYFRNGELINIKYRDGAKRFKLVKDAERVFYNLDACSIAKEIIIVEGEIDALTFVEIGMVNVVSTPNGSTLKGVNLDYLDNSIEYFANKEKIYLALDKDEAGQNVTKELIRRLGSERCYLVDFKDVKDANEFLLKYGAGALRAAIDDAKIVPLDGVSSVGQWKDKFEEYLLHGMQSGYKIGKPSFDGIFSTYTGQYIVVTGIPSSGKSDFVDEMCVGYNRNYGWKVAVASPENKPNEIHAGKILAKLCGKWANTRADVYSDWFNKSVDYMDSNFKYIDLDGTYDLESVLNKAKDMIFRYGIKLLVIDPYNKIKLKSAMSKDVVEYTNNYLLMVDEFARKHDILIILVAHPRKPSVDGTKTYEPSFYDIKGGGEFYDMTPHGILVDRDYVNDVVKIKVLKVKFSHLGKNNKYVYMKWNEANGRYIEFGYQSEDPKMLSEPKIDNTNWLVEDEKNIEEPPMFDTLGYPVNEVPY